MNRYIWIVSALALAGPVWAQQSATSAGSAAQPPEVRQATQAYFGCLVREARAQPLAMTAEAATERAYLDCASEKANASTVFNRWMAGAQPERVRVRSDFEAALQRGGRTYASRIIRETRGVPAVATPTPVPVAPQRRTPPTPQDVAHSYQAFAACVSRAASGRRVPTGMTASAFAGQIMAGCAVQRAELERRHENWIGSPAFPASLRAQTRVDRALSLNAVETLVAQQFADQARRSAPRPIAPAPPAPASSSPQLVAGGPPTLQPAIDAHLRCVQQRAARIPATVRVSTGANQAYLACDATENGALGVFNAWRSGTDATAARERRGFRVLLVTEGLKAAERTVLAMRGTATPPPPRALPGPAAHAKTTAAPIVVPPDVHQADQAVIRCHQAVVAAVPAAMTPEAGARQAMTRCAVERTAFATRFEAWVNRSSYAEPARANLRQQLRTQIVEMEGRLAARIRAARNAALAEPVAAANSRAAICAPAVLYFGFGEATLTDRARQSIEDFVRGALPFSRTGPIAVAGHDDVEPYPAARNGLSQRRAEEVKAALVAAGIPAHRVATSWYASGRPRIEVPRGTREPDNRRVELTCSSSSGW